MDSDEKYVLLRQLMRDIVYETPFLHFNVHFRKNIINSKNIFIVKYQWWAQCRNGDL